MVRSGLDLHLTGKSTLSRCILVCEMASISDTHTQLLEIVMPGHANSLGNLHGGHMMGWLVTAGSLGAMRIAKGPIVLGAIDDVNFLNPVLVNQIVILEAQVEYVGTSSMEVGASAVSEDPGNRRAQAHNILPHGLCSG